MEIIINNPVTRYRNNLVLVITLSFIKLSYYYYGLIHLLNSTTSFLTATDLKEFSGAGITAAAGTRLALQLLLVKGFKLYSFQLHYQFNDKVLLLVVTTSMYYQWVICAPAAFLGSTGRFSIGPFSGIEP